MDKIDFSAASLLSSLKSGSQKQGAKKAGAGAELKGKGKTAFSEMLKDSEAFVEELGPLREFAPSEEALTELMDAVHSAGSDLADRPFHDEILRYKKAVRDFVHYVVENSYTIERSQTRRGGRIKTHVQVQVIDRKLEELAAAILSGQSGQLQRISKIDEIKGLLVDLTITGVIKERDG